MLPRTFPIAQQIPPPPLLISFVAEKRQISVASRSLAVLLLPIFSPLLDHGYQKIRLGVQVVVLLLLLLLLLHNRVLILFQQLVVLVRESRI
jgi:hypothetical protein